MGGTGIPDGGLIVVGIPANLAVGPHTAAFDYAGSASFPAGRSLPFTFQVVNPPAGVIPVVLNPVTSTVNYGQPISILADNGYNDATSTGQFDIDGRYAGGFNYTRSVSLTLNQNLLPGTHTIDIYFRGTPNYAPSGGTATVTVVSAIPVVTIDPVIHQGGAGAMSIALNCTSNCGSGAVFLDGNYAFGTGLSDQGTAFLTLPTNLALGTHTAVFNYGGSASVAPGDSAPVTFQVVTPAASAVPVAMSISANPVPLGQSATIVADNGYDDGVHVGGIYLNGQSYGGFTYTRYQNFTVPPNLPAGSYTAEIKFSGTANYTPMSGFLNFTVQ